VDYADTQLEIGLEQVYDRVREPFYLTMFNRPVAQNGFTGANKLFPAKLLHYFILF